VTVIYEGRSEATATLITGQHLVVVLPAKFGDGPVLSLRKAGALVPVGEPNRSVDGTVTATFEAREAGNALVEGEYPGLLSRAGQSFFVRVMVT
jgi:hypothetical protein